MTPDEKIVIILSILFFIGFEAYLILQCKELTEKKRKLTKKTTGTVTSRWLRFWSTNDTLSKHERNKRYAFELQYQVGGQNYTEIGHASYVYIGEKWTVYYNPDNPQECQIGGGTGFAIFVYYFTIIFMVVAYIIVFRTMILRMQRMHDEEDDIGNETEYIEEIESEQEDIMQDLDTLI